MRHSISLRFDLLEVVPTRGTQRRKIMDFIHGLQDHPNAPGDFVERDASLRELQAKLIGKYAVSYWLDDPARKL